ncbi:MAG: hypothetical protein P4L51_16140 [Puia sp.]|nr:hypothetical protein [Puia sp.]
MKQLYLALLLVLVTIIATTGCHKIQPSVYANNPITSYYMPLAIGKYITYRMDSLTFFYFGQLDTTSSYLAKDIVEDSITDNLGRPGWVVTRYLSDTTGTAPWQPAFSYVVTPTVNTIEVNENNLRYVKLKLPMSNTVTWNGDTYLDQAPFQDEFSFSNQINTNLWTWNFTYQNINQPFVVSNNTTYDSSVTVLQVNDSSGIPIIDTVFASRTYWTETYAKNIGLIYRQTTMWEYQPAPPDGSEPGYKIGFGLKLSIVDHN